MNKFFSILILSFIFTTTANAQQGISEETKKFIIQTFPGYMPEYVLNNAENIAITEKYARKHDDQYQYVDLKGNGYNGSLRVGDTVLVFKHQAFFSKGQMLYMVKIQEQKAQKQPKTPEQRAQTAQTVNQVITTVANIGGRLLNTNIASNTVNRVDGGLVRIGN